jgi:hypothetical protein
MALAAMWLCSAIFVVLGSAHFTSMVDRVALTVFGLLPPLVLWFWWNEPVPSMSERIHEARDGQPTRRR